MCASWRKLSRENATERSGAHGKAFAAANAFLLFGGLWFGDLQAGTDRRGKKMKKHMSCGNTGQSTSDSDGVTGVAEALARLKAVAEEVAALQSALAVMSWDQETYMPPGGAEERAKQMATLARLAHEKWTSDEVGQLLEDARTEVHGADPDSYEALYVHNAARQYEKARKLPARLAAELKQAAALALEAWRAAKETADFSRFAPHLERLVALNIEQAERLGYTQERYDALLDLYEPEMPTQAVADVFARLKEELVPLVAAVAQRPQVDDSPLRGRFDRQAQWELGMDALRAIGFDLNRGRQDVSAHPFTISFSRSDVRITTRVKEEDWTSALFSTLHEAGHGMHAQGIPADVDGTPLMWRMSLGISESQSRLWENVVGRSKAFWEYFLPRLHQRFPQLAPFGLDAVYRAVNKVERSLIRTEADELTYNLHIFVRFDLERELIAQRLPVADLPEAWNAKMKEYVGVVPDSDSSGVLQDIHWSQGAFGYFPTYTLGNLLSVQFFDQAVQENPEIPDLIRRGEFDALRIWTNERIHRYGAMYPPMEIVRRVTGRGLDSRPYLNYLRAKYGEIYGL